MRAHGPQLLTAMISGLDDGDDPHSLVALEAMAGLAKLLGLAEPEDLRAVLLHTAIRIRPFFDSVGGRGREGSHSQPGTCSRPSCLLSLSPCPTCSPGHPGSLPMLCWPHLCSWSGPWQAGSTHNTRTGCGGEGPRAWCCGWQGWACLGVIPMSPQEKMEFRSVSIRLFGHLNKACHGACEDVFLEQVVGGLVPLLLHLRDPQASVAAVSGRRGWGEPGGAGTGRALSAAPQACRFALRMCGPNLECEELAAVFQKHLQDGRGLHFGEFLNAACKHLVRGGRGLRGCDRMGCVSCVGVTAWGAPDGWRPLQMCYFPDLLGRLVSTSLFYFKSSWEDVRAAAPMLTGEGPPLRPSPGPAPPPDPNPCPQGSWCCTWSPSSRRRWTWSSSWPVSSTPPPKVRAQGPLPPPPVWLHRAPTDPVGTRGD